MTKEEEIEEAWRQHLSRTYIPMSMRRTQIRNELAEHQGWLCHYCGIQMTEYNGVTRQETDVSLDHKTPISHGGLDEIQNLVAACSKCNNTKADMSYDDFMNCLERV